MTEFGTGKGFASHLLLRVRYAREKKETRSPSVMLGVGKAVPRTLLTPASHPLLWCLLPPQESAEGTSG